MLVRFFRSQQPFLLIILPVLSVLLWVPAFLHPVALPIKHEMPFYDLIAMPLSAYPLAATILAFFLIVLQAFLFNYTIDKYEITGKSSYLPALLYVLFTSFSPSLLHLHPVLFANIFIILALNRVLGTYRSTSALSACFDAGFLIGIASLFYFPAIIILFFVMVGIFILRPFSLREFTIIFLGFLLPYLYINTWYFVFGGGLEYLWIDKVWFPLINRDTTFNGIIAQPYSELILFVAIAIVLSIGRGFDVGNRSVQHRSNLTVLRWFFVFAVLTMLLAPTLAYMYFFIALIPLLIILTGYFLWARLVWLAELVLWLLIVTIIYNHF